LLAALVAVGAVVYALRFLLVPVALAFLLRYCLLPLVDLLENRGLPRWASVLVCFGALLGALVGVALAIWPSLNSWLSESPAPGERSIFEVQLERRLDEWEVSGRSMYPTWTGTRSRSRRAPSWRTSAATSWRRCPQLALEALSHVGTLALAPVIGLFLLLDGAAMHRPSSAGCPNRYFETVLVLLHRVDRQIASYLRGAASESTIVAVLLSTALWVAGMPGAISWAASTGCSTSFRSWAPSSAPAPAALRAGGSGGPGAGRHRRLLRRRLRGGCHAHQPWWWAAASTCTARHHPRAERGRGLAGIVGMLVSVPTLAVGKAIITTLREAWRHGQLRRVG
jgi:predicted PurR-regulated permease PerM